MKLAKQLRLSSALWASPVALGVTLYYFYVIFDSDFAYSRGAIEYAPEVVSFALNPAAALAYAAAASLAAWESGRLRDSGVWAIAPYRSRYRIAAQALLPVMLLTWLMLLIPAIGGLLRENVTPTLPSFPLLATCMAVSAAHCVIGFAVGRVVPKLIAAPILAMGIFYIVAASASSGEAFWPRHLLGQYHGVLAFGTTLPFKALAPHILFAGGLAAGAAILWVRPRNHRNRLVVPAAALAVAVAGTTTAYAQVSSWGPATPLSVGHAELTCAGKAPRLCVPRAGRADPAEARADVTAVTEQLKQAGVKVDLPEAIQDNVINGNRSRASTKTTWWLPLTTSQRNNTTRYEALRLAVHFPCTHAKDEVFSRSAMLWAAEVTGQSEMYMKRQRAEADQFTNGDELLRAVQKRVTKVRARPHRKQAVWYRQELKRACSLPSTGGEA